MKKVAVLFISTLALNVAKADNIKCVFTEPFINTTYSMSKSTLTYDGIEDGSAETKKIVIKNVSFQIKGAGVFELVSKDGKVLQTLTLNSQGSDGMSDNVYPYEVKDKHPTMSVNGGVGGCSSNYLKVNQVK